MIFEDRFDAGKRLAEKISVRSFTSPVIVALPRGGVPVACEIAKILDVALDILIVSKIGAPLNPEYGIGAVTEDGFFYIDGEVAKQVEASQDYLEKKVSLERLEIKRRISYYRGNLKFPSLKGKTAIVVDDGLATGVTARVASRYLKEVAMAEKVVLAIPVCSQAATQSLTSFFDEIIYLSQPSLFFSVGQYYRNFEQLTDDEVLSLLTKYRFKNDKLIDGEVEISDNGIKLFGTLKVPPGAKGLVIFAHGSGSGRTSPRNIEVAESLFRRKLASLLFDLLTEEESLNRTNIFNIPLLGDRLIMATRWVERQRGFSFPIGYFGASTGAAAAFWAAAKMGESIVAIVSRGGRPDLAFSCLSQVYSPTLLIVGGKDGSVISVNQQANKLLPHGKLVIVANASHLFEEVGALDKVSRLALEWFEKYFEKQKNIAA